MSTTIVDARVMLPDDYGNAGVRFRSRDLDLRHALAVEDARRLSEAARSTGLSMAELGRALQELHDRMSRGVMTGILDDEVKKPAPMPGRRGIKLGWLP